MPTRRRVLAFLYSFTVTYLVFPLFFESRVFFEEAEELKVGCIRRRGTMDGACRLMKDNSDLRRVHQSNHLLYCQQRERTKGSLQEIHSANERALVNSWRWEACITVNILFDLVFRGERGAPSRERDKDSVRSARNSRPRGSNRVNLQQR